MQPLDNLAINCGWVVIVVAWVLLIRHVRQRRRMSQMLETMVLVPTSKPVDIGPIRPHHILIKCCFYWTIIALMLTVWG